MKLVAGLKILKSVWPKVKNVFSIPETEKQYKNLVKILDILIDEIAENEKHPMTALLETQ